MNALTISDLHKSFGEKQVLRGLSMEVPEHSIFGFVGKNGAGKTTVMKTVLGLLRADRGEIRVDGKQVVFGETKTNRVIGYLPDVPEFYPFMTASEYLRLCGECLGMDRAQIRQKSDELLELVGLAKENAKIQGFSRGMKQRLGIAQALLGSPKLLICDEPTSALDPMGRKEILEVLQSVREQATVLFSTHILSDVERICTDAAFLHEGKIVMQGSVSELKALQHGQSFTVEVASPLAAQALQAQFPTAKKIQADTLCFVGDENLMNAVLSHLASNRLPLRRIEWDEPSLESVFMEVASK